VHRVDRQVVSGVLNAICSSSTSETAPTVILVIGAPTFVGAAITTVDPTLR
jgi:hypothetical protein